MTSTQAAQSLSHFSPLLHPFVHYTRRTSCLHCSLIGFSVHLSTVLSPVGTFIAAPVSTARRETPLPRNCKSLFDANRCLHLFKDASLTEPYGIPRLMDCIGKTKPRGMVPLDKAAEAIRAGKTHQHVCGFVSDRWLIGVFTNTDAYIKRFREFDGVIIPDLSIVDGLPPCINQANVAFSRALGLYLQRRSIPVIPTVRWGEPPTYSYCFTGIPRHSMVAVGTVSCLKSRKSQQVFVQGFEEMLQALEPATVLIYGRMPEKLFGPFIKAGLQFEHYPSRVDAAHGKDLVA